MNRWPIELDERIWQLRQSGVSIADTALAIGRPKTHTAWRIGVIRRRKGLVRPYDEEGRPERHREVDPTPEEITAMIGPLRPRAHRTQPPAMGDLQAEVTRCRRMAIRHGWTRRPERKRHLKVA